MRTGFCVATVISVQDKSGKWFRRGMYALKTAFRLVYYKFTYCSFAETSSFQKYNLTSSEDDQASYHTRLIKRLLSCDEPTIENKPELVFNFANKIVFFVKS